jgi:hypothetical protein
MLLRAKIADSIVSSNSSSFVPLNRLAIFVAPWSSVNAGEERDIAAAPIGNIHLSA